MKRGRPRAEDADEKDATDRKTNPKKKPFL
jgi:hypothetical protein